MAPEGESEAVAAEFSEGEPIERRRQRRVLDEIFFSDEEEVLDDAADIGQAMENAGPRRSGRLAQRDNNSQHRAPEFWIEPPRLTDEQRAGYGPLIVRGQSEEEYRWVGEEGP